MKVRPKGSSYARYGHFYRSFTVRDVGCDGDCKRWTDVRGSHPQKGQRELGIIPILSR